MEDTAEYWCKTFGVDRDSVPLGLFLYGTRYLQENVDFFSRYFENVVYLDKRHHFIKDAFIGLYKGKPMAFAAVYGAPMAAEVAHIFCRMGVKFVLQSGSCGSLSAKAPLGSFICVDNAYSGEGVSQYYSPKQKKIQSIPPAKIIAKLLDGNLENIQIGSIFTTSAIFMETPLHVKRWKSLGCIVVDLETSAVFSVCRSFKVNRGALLWVSDAVTQNKDSTSNIEIKRDYIKDSLIKKALPMIAKLSLANQGKSGSSKT